jgi:hypothetical protein
VFGDFPDVRQLSLGKNDFNFYELALAGIPPK